MKIKIERLQKKDKDNFYKFARNFVIREYKDYSLPIRHFYWRRFFNKKKIEEYLSDKSEIVLVAKDKDKIIGFLKGFIGYGGSSWINWLGVEKNYRGRGIGTKLLEEAEKFFKKKLCHFIQCCTENMKLVGFYRKRGWILVGLQKEAWCGQDEYLLQKNIDKPHFELWK